MKVHEKEVLWCENVNILWDMRLKSDSLEQFVKQVTEIFTKVLLRDYYIVEWAESEFWNMMNWKF